MKCPWNEKAVEYVKYKQFKYVRYIRLAFANRHLAFLSQGKH
jgi:hypothetical protein